MRDYKVYSHTGSEGWLRDQFFLLLLFAVPFLAALGRLPLFGPYEGRYAEVSREMLERGDLITPFLNHVVCFENPPLLYWLNTASLKFFGLGEGAVRFPSALCGLLTLPAVYFMARRLFDRRTALLSAILLGCCNGFVLLSRAVLVHLPLTLCLLLALGSFIVAAQRDDRRRGARGAWYPFYLFCALAVLAGGMTALVLSVSVILVYLMLAGRWELLLRMRCASGLLLFLVVAAPWFVAVWLEHPEFSRYFLDLGEWGRYGVPAAGDQRPFWLLLPLLAVLLIPWSGYVPSALAKAWREQGKGTGRPALFLLIWVLAIFLRFVLSGSRSIPALLPAFPPLAILTARLLKDELERRSRGLTPATRFVGGGLIILGMVVLVYPLLVGPASGQGGTLGRLAQEAPRLSMLACLPVALLLLFQGGAALAVSQRRTGRALIVICLCAFALDIILPRLIMGTVAASSPRDLARAAARLAGSGGAVVTVGPLHGVSWYAGRQVLVASVPGEGPAAGGDAGSTAETLPVLWRGGSRLLVILDRRELELLRPLLRPAPHILLESGQRLLISNRPGDAP